MSAQPQSTEPSFVHDIDAESGIFDSATGTLKLLAEPTRLHILWLLSERERYVTELVEVTGVARTVVSQHLAKLRLGGLEQTRRVGRSVIYRVDDGHLTRLVFESLNHADHQMTGEPAHE